MQKIAHYRIIKEEIRFL